MIKPGKIPLFLLLFFLFGAMAALFKPQTVLAATFTQTLAQSTVGDKVYEINGSSWYDYGQQIPVASAPGGWQTVGFNDAAWTKAIDAFSQDGADYWWCQQFPLNCHPVGTNIDQITGPSGFVNKETLLFRKAFTVSPPAGYYTQDVILTLWSDNASWAYVNGSLIATGGLNQTTVTNLANTTSIMSIASLSLQGYSATDSFTKEFAVQVSNDDPTGCGNTCKGNPIGLQYKIVATYAPLVTLSGRVTDNASPAQGIANVTLNQGYDTKPGPPACNIGTATTDSNGYFSFTVPDGQGFCIRGPSNGVSGYSGPNRSYECQIAGRYANPDGCGFGSGNTTNPTSLDMAADNAYNFVYTSTAPAISSLQIGNNSNRAADFTSTLKMSGLQSTQGGIGWYNPMTITLNASKGTGDITDYYVAFYDKTLTQAATASTFLSDVTANFNSATKAKNGFLLGYSAANAKYYVWDYSATTSTVGASNCNTNGCFVEITGPFRQICGKDTSGNKDCTNKLYYTVYPGDSLAAVTPNPTAPRMWTVALDKTFGSKTMYTATYVTDSNNLSDFNANINPVYP